jgi:alkanesulfonate monooxygenase SsuD/methylene tetrahydromethanopterin reductase-like flavin-dependent oxidoreductase (luciferase family)
MQYLRFFGSLDRKAAFQSKDYEVYKGGLTQVMGSATYEDMDNADCMIFGSPERCIRRLQRAEKDYRLTYPIFEVNFGGFAHEQVMRSMERFAKEVMPHLR